MQFSDRSFEDKSPNTTWKSIMDWAQTHYRDRIFNKDEQIPVRPQLIYLVNQGAVRLVSENTSQLDIDNNSVKQLSESDSEFGEEAEKTFLGFVSAGKPFEILAHQYFNFNAYAHVDYTQVAWLYWQDLENWSDFRQEIYEAFRDRHQQKLLWLSALGQRRTIDRLTSFLYLLIEEYGEECDREYCLPYTLTHAQIGSAIGSTRVTVTRLMGKLRRQGIISVKGDNSICINDLKLVRDNLNL